MHDAEAPSASMPPARTSYPSGGFFRAVLIGLGLSAPFWIAAAWLLSRIV